MNKSGRRTARRGQAVNRGLSTRPQVISHVPPDLRFSRPGPLFQRHSRKEAARFDRPSRRTTRCSNNDKVDVPSTHLTLPRPTRSSLDLLDVRLTRTTGVSHQNIIKTTSTPSSNEHQTRLMSAWQWHQTPKQNLGQLLTSWLASTMD